MSTLTIDMGFSQKDLRKIPYDEIEKVCIGPNSPVKDFDFLKKFLNIRIIQIESEFLLDFSFVNSLGRLQKILGLPCKITGLIDNPNLEELYVDYSRNLHLTEHCQSLRALSISSCTAPEIFFCDLKKLNALKYLFIYKGSFQDLKYMDGLHLEELILCSITKLHSLDGIENLSRTLRSLRIESIKNIEDYSALSNLEVLETLVISKSREIRDLSFLNHLPALHSLRIVETKILDKNIDQLEKIQKLALYKTGLD